MRLVLVDIGNSAIKLADLSQAEGKSGHVAHFKRVENWSDFDFSALPGEPLKWIVSSVKKSASGELEDQLSQNRPQDKVVFASCENIGLKVSTDQPEQVGVDRLVAAAAAWQHVGEEKSVVVVDAGTAVTIDVATRDGEFLGGLIYPGPAASFRQLNEQTSALPNLDFASRKKTIAGWQAEAIRERSTAPWQTNTVNAITAGIFRAQLAALDRGVSDFAASIDGPVQIFLTGGAVPELLAAGEVLGALPGWIERAIHDPRLVLEGLKAIGSRSEK